MPGPVPLPITLSDTQQTLLERLLRQHTCPQALALRLRIILGADQGHHNVP